MSAAEHDLVWANLLSTVLHKIEVWFSHESPYLSLLLNSSKYEVMVVSTNSADPLRGGAVSRMSPHKQFHSTAQCSVDNVLDLFCLPQAAHWPHSTGRTGISHCGSTKSWWGNIWPEPHPLLLALQHPHRAALHGRLDCSDLTQAVISSNPPSRTMPQSLHVYFCLIFPHWHWFGGAVHSQCWVRVRAEAAMDAARSLRGTTASPARATLAPGWRL